MKVHIVKNAQHSLLKNQKELNGKIIMAIAKDGLETL
jgi:hypothetical protein